MKRPNVIVILDDYPEWQQLHRKSLSQIPESQGMRLECFSSDAVAMTYVQENFITISGYVQDLSRSDLYLNKPAEGIQFFDEAISKYTPEAWTLIVSGSATPEHMRHLFRSSKGPIDVLDKGSLTRGEFNDVAAQLITKWIKQRGFSEEVSVELDVSVVQLVLEPWREITQYIAKNPSFLHTMPSRRFEELVAQIYLEYGWEVDLTAKTRDGGFDILAIRREFPNSIKLLIEAKRFSPEHPVGVGVVRALYGLRNLHSASQVILATSSRVSRDAKKEFIEKVPWEIDFLERDKILEWCRTFGALKLGGDL